MEEDAASAKELAEAKELRIRELQRDLVGVRYAGATLASVNLPKSTGTEIAKWLDKGEYFLVFLGAPGIGKTYFCAALLAWKFGKYRSVRYWNERDLFSRLRNVISSDKGDMVKELHNMTDDEFMIFDDLASSSINEWRSEMLFELIDRRYESKLPTVFTSNLTKDELFKALGPRSHSRLFAKQNTIIEMHEAADLRKEGK